MAALARVERNLGNLSLALVDALEAIEISNNIAVPTYLMWGELERGLVRLAQGDLETALAHTQRAIDLMPQSDEAWISTEQVYRAQSYVLRALCRIEAADKDKVNRLSDGIIEAKAARIPNLRRRQHYLEFARHDL